MSTQLRSPLSNSSLSSNQPSSSGSSSGGQNSPNSSTGSNASYSNNPLSSSSSFASFLNFNHPHRTHYHNPLLQSENNVVASSQLNQIYDSHPGNNFANQKLVKSATVRSSSNSGTNNNNNIYRQKNNTMAAGMVVDSSSTSNNSQQSMFKVSCNSLIQLNQLQGSASLTTAPRPFARKKHLQQQLSSQFVDSLKPQRTMNASTKCNNEFRMTEIVNLKQTKLNGSTSCINLQSVNCPFNNSNSATNFVNKSNFNRSIHSLNQGNKQPSIQTLLKSSGNNSTGSVVKSTSSSSPGSRRSPNTPDLGYNTLLSSFTSNEMPSTSAISKCTANGK